MPISQINTHIAYVPAELREVKVWYIRYYVVNPQTKKLQLIRIKVNRVKMISERRKLAKEMVRQINIKLSNGWNPLIEHESKKRYHKINDVADTFLKVKERELRPDSMRSYESFIKKLKENISKYGKVNELYVVSYNKNMAVEFLQGLYLKNRISEISYNNHLTFYRLFFNWCIQNNYCKVNPFAGILKKKEKEKKRITVDIDERERLKKLLYEDNYNYFVICMIAYYCFIRPKEITFLQVKNIDIEGQMITIPGQVAKNGKERTSTIPDVLKQYMIKLNLDQYNKNMYLISEDFKPGYRRIDPRVISRKWNKIRNELGFPMEIQFYSLKDSGIIEMIHENIPLEMIRDQADHSSLEVTNIYSKFANNNISQEIKKKCKEF